MNLSLFAAASPLPRAASTGALCCGCIPPSSLRLFVLLWVCSLGAFFLLLGDFIYFCYVK